MSFQPRTTKGAAIQTRVGEVTLVTLSAYCLQGLPSYMLEIVGVAKRGMLQLTNLEDSRCRRWCAAIVLFAVWSLTVSVATRYTFLRVASDNRVTTVQKHVSLEPGRQRLMKNAATWMPPVVCTTVLQAPSSYPRISPAGPPIPSLFFEQSLYNRPPPSSDLFV